MTRLKKEFHVAEKKKGFDWESVIDLSEVPVGSWIRPWFFESMKRWSEKFRSDPQTYKVWRGTMWMYKRKPDASYGTFNNIVIAAATGAAWMLNWFRDRTGFVGKLIDLFGQQLLEDITGNLQQIAEAVPESEFENYNGPTDAELKEFGEKVHQELKKELTLFIQRLPYRLQFRNDAFLGGPGTILGETLLMQEDAEFNKFLSWFEGLDEKTKRRVIIVSPAINNPGEFAMFIRRPEVEMTAYINTRYSLGVQYWIDPEMIETAVAALKLVEQAESWRKDTARRRKELVGKYAPTTPPYFVGNWVVLVLIVMIVLGFGFAWIMYASSQHPMYDPIVAVPGIPGTHPINIAPEQGKFFPGAMLWLKVILSLLL